LCSIPLPQAFFGQETPNTGEDENGVVIDHPGFNPAGSGGILDLFPGADFTQSGYKVMTITVAGEMDDYDHDEPTSGAFSHGMKAGAVICTSFLSVLLV